MGKKRASRGFGIVRVVVGPLVAIEMAGARASRPGAGEAAARDLALAERSLAARRPGAARIEARAALAFQPGWIETHEVLRAAGRREAHPDRPFLARSSGGRLVMAVRNRGCSQVLLRRVTPPRGAVHTSPPKRRRFVQGRIFKVTRVATLLISAQLALVVLAEPAAAQKLGRVYHEDVFNGFRFKYPHEWTVTPVQEQFKAMGMTAEFRGPAEQTRISSTAVIPFTPDVLVLSFYDEGVAPTDDAEDEGELRSRVTRRQRRDVTEVIARLMGHFQDFDKDAPIEDETRKVKGVEARRRTWQAFTGNFDVTLDTWTFPLEDRDICLLFRIPEQHAKKYLRVFEKSARTFEEIEREASAELSSTGTYEDMLAYHMQEASQIPGWRALPTPSRKFIIKTSSDDDRFIDEVIGRLEKSREIFEQDFPPEKPMEAVSVVRVCKDAKEFRAYGNVSYGVAGFFSPRTKELVLYDAIERDRNSTYAVMTHEAFHQYCHYLFGESEAHRWFDEGHGDYYGGMKFTPRKAVITARMPAGLNRLDHVRELVRNGRTKEGYRSVEDHINYSHREWQSQGPINVSCYSQSWSIIYMLRQGALGKVPKKVWKDEYADIVPDYIRTLNEGFRAAYAELREELLAEANEEGEELSEEDLEFDSTDLDSEKKQEIWDAAIAASWGKIDLEQFEEDWCLYVKKHLKD